MIFNWPELKTAKANSIASELKSLCDDLEKGVLTTREKISAFNDILKGANDRKHYQELTNTERKKEFHLLCSIVYSIFWYFHNGEMCCKVRPDVFRANVKFFAYYRPL